MGSRRLQRRFRDQVGVSAKRLARIGRFQRAARLLSETVLPGAAIAVDSGYADQSHLGREFQEMAGISPGRYRREEHALGDVFLSGSGQAPQGG
jgi:transcriptional regulator GlxA family with amidase domain